MTFCVGGLEPGFEVVGTWCCYCGVVSVVVVCWVPFSFVQGLSCVEDRFAQVVWRYGSGGVFGWIVGLDLLEVLLLCLEDAQFLVNCGLV